MEPTFSVFVHNPAVEPRPTSIPKDHLVVSPPHDGFWVGRTTTGPSSIYIETMACPPRYYDNCLNSSLLCSSCCAGGGDTPYYYPVEDIGPHPAIGTPTSEEDIKAARRARRKRGRASQKAGAKAERDALAKLGGTHNPTSQGHDGLVDGLRVEYKVRLSGDGELPTRAEWEKAKREGNRLVVVENKVTGECTVTMSMETFERIRGAAP